LYVFGQKECSVNHLNGKEIRLLLCFCDQNKNSALIYTHQSEKIVLRKFQTIYLRAHLCLGLQNPCCLKLPFYNLPNFNNQFLTSRDKCVPIITTWRFLRLRMEERPSIWRIAANILNKQWWTADMEWSSSLGVERGANNSSP